MSSCDHTKALTFFYRKTLKLSWASLGNKASILVALVGSVGYTWTGINSSTGSPRIPLSCSNLVSSHTRLRSNFSSSGPHSSNTLQAFALLFSLVGVSRDFSRSSWRLDCSLSGGSSARPLCCPHGVLLVCCFARPSLCGVGLSLTGAKTSKSGEPARVKLLGRELPKFFIPSRLTRLERPIVLAS